MTTLVAKVTFAGPGSRIVSQGDLVDSTDEIVKGREAWFETVDAAAQRPAEVIHRAVPADVEPVDVDNADKPKTTRTRKG